MIDGKESKKYGHRYGYGTAIQVIFAKIITEYNWIWNQYNTGIYDQSTTLLMKYLYLLGHTNASLFFFF